MSNISTKKRDSMKKTLRKTMKKQGNSNIFIPYFSQQDKDNFENILFENLKIKFQLVDKKKLKRKILRKWSEKKSSSETKQLLISLFLSIFSEKNSNFKNWLKKSKSTKAFKQIETKKNIVRNFLLNQLNKNQYPWDNESINNINSLYIDYDENGCVVDKTYLNPLFIEDKSQTKCVSKEELLEINNKIKEKNIKKLEDSRAKQISPSLIDKCNKDFLKEIEALDIHIALPVYNREFLQNIIKESNNYMIILEIIIKIQETTLEEYYKENDNFNNLSKLQRNFSLSSDPPQLPWSKTIQEELFKLDHKDLNLKYKSFKL